MTLSSSSSRGPGPWNWQPAGPARLEQPVTLLRLEGADTLRFLHGQSSQDLASAQPGEWRSTCCITPTARMRALAEVIVDDDGAWLVIGAGDAGEVRRSLDRVLFPADRVRLGELRPGRRILPLPQAGDAATASGGRWTPLAEGEGWWLGESLVLAHDTPLPQELTQRTALGDAEAERWRISRGIPAAPAEINEETNPFELGLAHRVSLEKGCYVGQETLARLATYDGVRRQLRRWSCRAHDGADPGPETVLVDERGERAGVITSCLRLAQDGWIGLALVRRRWLSEPVLRAGGSPDGPTLHLSLPEAFTPPPVGSGGSRREGDSAG